MKNIQLLNIKKKTSFRVRGNIFLRHRMYDEAADGDNIYNY